MNVMNVNFDDTLNVKKLDLEKCKAVYYTLNCETGKVEWLDEWLATEKRNTLDSFGGGDGVFGNLKYLFDKQKVYNFKIFACFDSIPDSQNTVSRNKLITEIISFLQKYKFDGLDTTTKDATFISELMIALPQEFEYHTRKNDVKDVKDVKGPLLATKSTQTTRPSKQSVLVTPITPPWLK